MTYPILYSFRRCPYAMRARMALGFAEICVELREVVLRNKPQALLDISPKATVPVLLLPDSQVLEESLDIMHWALTQNDPKSLKNELFTDQINQLISRCDHKFKPLLDRYKYFDRYPEKSQLQHRQEAEIFVSHLNELLAKHTYLLSDLPTLADIAIFPFIRQFAKVDWEWFESSSYSALKRWLILWMENPLFKSVMKKFQPWEPGANPELFLPTAE